MQLGQVGDTVGAKRVAQKLSMRAAAELAGVSVTTWSDLEAGKYPPSMKTQRGVAAALNLKLEWYDLLSDGASPSEVDAPRGTATSTVRAMSDRERISQLESELAAVERLQAQVGTMTQELDRLGATVQTLEAEVQQLKRRGRRGGA